MKRMNRTFAILAGAILGSAGLAYGQEPPRPAVPPPVEDEIFVSAEGLEGAEAPAVLGGIEVLGFGGLHGNRVVKGSPFSAVSVSETTQVLPDGNRIHRTTSAAMFRDSEGRFRREVTLPAIGPLAASGKTPHFVSILDPVAGFRYMLDPDDKTVRKTSVNEKGRGPRGEFFEKRIPAPKMTDDVKTESLGTQVIEGVSAEGTRVTRTIPVGRIGNDKPIEIVSERWYSADLQMVVMTKRSDPRFGTTTYQLTKIQRQEPAAALFQVPSDYTVKEGHGGFGMRMRRHGPPREAPAPPPLPGESEEL
jgi:hypothetical protein